MYAMLVVFLCAFVPIVNSICIVMTAFITLRKGAFEGALVTCAAAAPYVIAYVVAPASGHTILPSSVVLGILLTSSVLVWLFALFLRRFNSWAVTLELAGLIGILLVIVVHIIHPDIKTWWASHLTTYFEHTSSPFGGQKSAELSGVTKEVQADMIARTKLYATGLMAVSILFNAMLQLLLARWWQAVIYNPGGLRKELYQIRLGYISVLAFFIGAVGSYFGNLIALDIMPVLYGVFAAAGLSLIHRLAALTKWGWFLLTVVYGGVIVMFPTGFEIIAIIALFDTLLDLRARFVRIV